jgi:Kef-type K+ transport system membrane component KefB
VDHHQSVPEFLGALAAMLLAAKAAGGLARRLGQPSVLGELLAGVVLGPSLLGWVDPGREVFGLLGELGVVVLLFLIGLETDLKALMKVGGAAATVALVGVVLPFALGYLVCYLMMPSGSSRLLPIVCGAALTATSVGITSRVLSDLGQLDTMEGRIILGAAVIDDVLGLIVLTVVVGLTKGEDVTAWGLATTIGLAVGFLAVTLVLGGFVVPPLFRLLSHVDLPGTPTLLALCLAFGLGWLADLSGSAVIIGAFAAGLLLAGVPQAHEIEHGVTQLGLFFVPLFFVTVGASVELEALDPTHASGRTALAIGVLLIVAAVIGKVAAGHAAFWSKGRKWVIGTGMVPRGEVGLIFASMGRGSGVLDAGLFGAVTLMVVVTTFLAPPCLKYLLGQDLARPAGQQTAGIEDLVAET